MAIRQTQVFISSAQRDEGTISWGTIRESIYERLKGDDQFCVFTIDREANPRPSTQHYLSEIESSDIVVSVIGNELRPGTEDEIRLAIQLGKPLFLYILKSNVGVTTQQLIKEIENTDSCTYCLRDDLHDIADSVYRDIKSYITDLIHGFISGKASKQIESDINSAVTTLPNATLELFGSSENLLARWLNLPCDERGEADNPYLCNLGERAIKWLYEGTRFSFDPMYTPPPFG